MKLPCLRFTVRRMMAAVAVVAVMLGLLPALFEVLETQIWYGSYPFNGGGVPPGHWIAEPRLGFLFIPLLALAVALDKPHRWIVRAAIATGLLPILAWVLLRRVLGVGPGSILIWPDSFLGLFRGRLPDLHLLQVPFFAVFAPSTVGELVDLLALLGLVGALATLSLPRPLPRRLRGLCGLAAIVTPCGEWLTRMWSDRHLGFGEAPFRFIGPGGYYLPRPSAIDLAQGCILAALLVYLVGRVAGLGCHTVRCSKPVPSRPGSRIEVSLAGSIPSGSGPLPRPGGAGS